MNPLKVMIVDDEILAVEDLERLIPREEKGFHIVAAATSSTKALELYQKFFPEIIFMDIRMPAMDGLELSRCIIAFGRPVRIALLTAYRDFEYAKQAVAIGVSNYLLKHDINEVSILGELEKMRRELEEESERSRFLRQRFLRAILEGQAVERGVGQKETAVYENPDLDYTLMIIAPDQTCLEELRASSRPEVKPPDFESLELPEFVSHYDVLYGARESVVFLAVKKTNSQLESRERSLKLANQFQTHIRKQTRETFSIVLTRNCRDKAELAGLYRKAVSASTYLIFSGRGKIIHSDDLPPTAPEIPQNEIEETLEKLSVALHELDIDQTGILIRNVFELNTNPIYNPDGLKTVCRRLVNLLELFQKEHHPLPVFKKQSPGNAGSVQGTLPEELRDWFLEAFTSGVRQVKTQNRQAFSKKMHQAIQYIHRHYAEDLTVDKVAVALGFSGAYLSQIFKRETERTFLEYLTDYRIEIAKNMLATGDYKIYEVAERVGYKTSQYFSQVFRKVTGLYPMDYREGGTKP